MNKEALENRKKDLEATLRDIEKQQAQLVANMNAVYGAIQEVSYWLNKQEETLE